MSYRTSLFLALLAVSSLALSPAGAVFASPDNPSDSSGAPHPAASTMSGKVKDIIEAAGYTYAQVDTGKEVVWAASTTTTLHKGDVITFSTAMPMYNFHSNALNRDFPVVYFSGRFGNGGAQPAERAKVVAASHAAIQKEAESGPVQGIKKVKGGNTIAELFNDRKKLAGTTVRVRGKVTKYTAGVMGKNWIHIRDSSGPEDLAVTTDGAAAIGDVIVAEGKLERDKNYGYGYVYPVIVEDAKVTRE
jgi:hypothetical protein